MKWLGSISLVMVMALVGCKDKGGDDSGGDLTGDATAGAAVYASSCAGCHGDNGNDGSAADLTAEVPEKSDAELEDIVLNGYDDMPAQDLSAQEMADLLAYLRETFAG